MASPAAVSPALLVPPALQPGSVVRVVAASGPFPPALVWRALGWLRERYEVRYTRRIFARCGYLAGEDEARLQELHAALVEPGVDALLFARGGYGLSRIAHRIDWTLLREQPRWLVGFSDVTAVHAEATRQAVASLHAGNATALGRGDDAARLQWLHRLEQPHAEQRFDNLRSVVPGQAAGPLVGGNLTLLHACAAAGRLRLPAGAVLLIEDIGEIPYRVDRALTTLIVGGHLRQLAAIVIGDFSFCRTGADGTSIEQVLTERLEHLGIPVATGLPVGHDLRNDAVVLLSQAQLECHPDRATLRLRLPK